MISTGMDGGNKERIVLVVARNNPQIWRLAKTCDFLFKQGDTQILGFDGCSEIYKNKMYDKAKMLNYMFLFNAFTGPDNHE